MRENVLAKDLNGVYDDSDVSAGQQIIVEDIGEQLGLEGLDVLICSVGGGGSDLWDDIGSGEQGGVRLMFWRWRLEARIAWPRP